VWRLSALCGPPPTCHIHDMAEVIRGRERELQAIAEFVDEVVVGPAGLVFEGDAGIGKTTIWSEAVARARTIATRRLLIARPARAEAGLAFNVLTDLLEPVFDDVVPDLPEPQGNALAIALLKVEPGPARLDQRAVAAATTSVLRRLAANGPTVLAIDDLQWVDPPSASVLAFALRRLAGLPVGLLASVRLGEPDVVSQDLVRSLDRCQRVIVGRLGTEPLRQLLEDRLERRFTSRALARIERVADGNPFFALEMARSLADGGSTSALKVPDRLQGIVHDRIASLSDRARDALLVVAAAGAVEVQVMLSILAGKQTAVMHGLEQAVAAGIVTLEDSRVTFRHPLFAAAVYESASQDERRHVHQLLARFVSDVEQRARHQAMGAVGPDADVADLLADAAEHARRRGAPETAAELVEHAKALTPADQTVVRQRRTIQGAEYAFHAGDLAAARDALLSMLAEECEGPQRADALRLLGEIRYMGDSFSEGIELLEEALKHAPDDHAIQGEIELRLAFGALATADYDAAAQHAHRALEHAEQAADPTLLAETLASVAGVDVLVGRRVDDAKIARALNLEDPHRPVSVMMRPSRVAAYLEFYAGHLSASDRLLEALRRRIIDGGEETEVPYVDSYLIWSACWRGDLNAAAAYADEALDAANRTGSESLRSAALGFAALPPAFAGDSGLVAARADEAVELAGRTGRRLSVRWASWALALVALAQDNPKAAHDALGPLAAPLAGRGIPEPIRAFFVPDEITALIGIGALDAAERLLDQFQEAAERMERAWALMLSDRCRALLLAARGDLAAASASAHAALTRCADLELRFEVARTLLVAGQLERRRRRRGAAADYLVQARDFFDQAGAELWAARARTELARLGHGRSAPTQLTPTEARVAELTASGLTNKEVAAQLFISAKTVEANLARIYRKLNIRSRAELGARLVSKAPPYT
jgi:DNA-binding CsgD family transcriptional regulator